MMLIFNEHIHRLSYGEYDAKLFTQYHYTRNSENYYLLCNDTYYLLLYYPLINNNYDRRLFYESSYFYIRCFYLYNFVV